MFIFKVRRDSAANWTQSNPVLRDGEPGFERDTRKLKIGDGVSRWTELGYVSNPADGSISDQQLLDHINSLTPHPAYDSGPSFTLLYENAKV